MAKRNAFTLIELLVVVSIIALLIGILLPSLKAVRGQARRVTCATQLHQVGIAMMTYMQDSRDRMPHVSYMPSIDPAPLTTAEPVYFADVLSVGISKQANLLQCPDDKPGGTDRPIPNVGKSFFESERSSYEYRWGLAGLTPMEFSQRPHGPPGHPHMHPEQKVSPNTIWFARDYDNFHGKAGQIGARRYVYIDGHVSDFEN
ncbi:MAG: prepilin-type N-terminal cleavage/methylation domain-containing protein [Phycisphaerae bacterium]|nr:prepilin-type N-terminal cleavage/methylation domain-containing protein [Phycisphaerae bacterium]